MTMGWTVKENVGEAKEVAGEKAKENVKILKELDKPLNAKDLKKIGSVNDISKNQLTELDKPLNAKDLKKIGKQAFEGCTQLYDLRLPKNIQYEQLTSARIDAVSAYVLGNLDASEEILSKVRGLIKTRREKLIQKIIESDSEQAFARFCDGWKKIKLEHLEEYIEIATKANATKVTVALLDYKQRNYSAKKQAAKEQDRVEKDLGVKVKLCGIRKKPYFQDV